MQGQLPVINAKYQISAPAMVGVGKAKDVVNKVAFALVVAAFKIPIRAFRAVIDQSTNSVL